MSIMDIYGYPEIKSLEGAINGGFCKEHLQL